MTSMSDKGVVAVLPTERPSHTHRVRRVAGAGLIATLAAVVSTTLAAALAQALGVDFGVADGGETIPLAGIAVVTASFSIVGIVIAAALHHWSACPAERFVWTAGTLIAISLVPLRGGYRRYHRPPGVPPRRGDGDDPHPGAEPPHMERSTNVRDRATDHRLTC